MSSLIIETPRKNLDCTREVQWIRDHRAEYAGQWVALEGDRLLAHGNNAVEVYETALRLGVEAPVLVQVQPGENMPFGGW